MHHVIWLNAQVKANEEELNEMISDKANKTRIVNNKKKKLLS